jgi:outer membrane protein assembly factor BamB
MRRRWIHAAWALAAATLPLAARAQLSPVFADDSVAARDGLGRVRELVQSGNTESACRLLQDLLEREGHRVLVSPADSQLYLPVRAVIFRTLLDAPELLARYRAMEDPAARRLLDEGRIEEVEEFRLLTTAGYHAALLLARRHLDAARFDAAKLTLEQLERHPDRADPELDRSAAELALQIAAYLDRPDAWSWAREWAQHAGVTGTVRSAETPPRARVEPRTPLDPGPMPGLAHLGVEPLQSVPLAGPEAERRIDTAPGAWGAGEERLEFQPWVLPTLFADMVLVNDGGALSALDRYTLNPLWTVHFSRVSRGRTPEGAGDLLFHAGALRLLDDTGTVAASPAGVAVASAGLSQIGSGRVGDSRVFGVNVWDGRVLWAHALPVYDAGLNETTLRGAPVIEADTVILALRRNASARRVASSVLLGLDLFTGATRWTRTVASTGVMAYQQQSRTAESGLAHRGMYYRSDELGAAMAIEAHTGRVRWIRTIPSAVTWMASGEIGPWSGGRPIVDGPSLIALDGARQIILRLDLESGAVLDSRPAVELGSPRYLVRVGSHLAAIGPERVAFVTLAELGKGTIRPGPAITAGARGRAVALGDRLGIPTRDGLVLIDPAAPDTPRLVPLRTMGNLITDEDNLLVVDHQRISTYLTWERAQALLERRLAQSPDNPEPAVTYAELALRAGMLEVALHAADRAAAIFASDPLGDRFGSARRRLFDLLMGSVSAGLDDASAGRGANLDMIARLAERAGRLAEALPQRVVHQLEAGRLAEIRNAPVQAFEIYQAIVLNPALADTPVRGQGVLPIPARQLAVERMRALIAAAGPAAYSRFDEEARIAFGLARGPAPGQTPAGMALRFEELARQYPVALVAPDLYAAAARQWEAAGRPIDAARALWEGFEAARAGLAAGRAEHAAILAELAGRLMDRLERDACPAAALRVLARFADALPRSTPTLHGSALDVAGVSARLTDALAAIARRPRIGTRVSREADILEGWLIYRPQLDPEWPGQGARRATDHLTMLNFVTRHVGLLAPTPGGGPLRVVWSRPYGQSPPDVLRVTADAVDLFWPTSAGGHVERIDAFTGRTRWKTPDLMTMLAEQPGPDRPADLPPWPDAGIAGPEVVLAADDATLLMGRRDGAVVAVDLHTGRRLWLDAGLTRLRDLAVGGGIAAIGGDRAGAGDTTFHLHLLDARTGRTLRRFTLDDTADAIRLTERGTVAVNSAKTFLAFRPDADGPVWRVDDLPLRGGVAELWLAGPRLIILERGAVAWMLDAETGRPRREPLDTRGRLGIGGEVRVSDLDDRTVLRGSGGIAVFDRAGVAVGAAALHGWPPLLTPEPAQGAFVTITTQRQPPGVTPWTTPRQTDPDAPQWARLAILDARTARLLATEPVQMWEDPRALAVIDGKIIISTTYLSLVLDAPPDP